MSEYPWISHEKTEFFPKNIQPVVNRLGISPPTQHIGPPSCSSPGPEPGGKSPIFFWGGKEPTNPQHIKKKVPLYFTWIYMYM